MKNVIRFVALLALLIVATGCEATEAHAVSAGHTAGNVASYILLLVVGTIVAIAALAIPGEGQLEEFLEGLAMAGIGSFLILVANEWRVEDIIFPLVLVDIVPGAILIFLSIVRDDQEYKITIVIASIVAMIVYHLLWFVAKAVGLFQSSFWPGLIMTIIVVIGFGAWLIGDDD